MPACLVSPLIFLMLDQVVSLGEVGVGVAIILSENKEISTQTFNRACTLHLPQNLNYVTMYFLTHAFGVYQALFRG